MQVGTIGRCALRVHPALLIVVLGAVVLGRLENLLWSFLALTLHESAHALTARSVGCQVTSIELMPFGGVAHLAQVHLTPRAEWIVAAAGPVCSLVIGAALLAATRVVPDIAAALLGFIHVNLLLGCVNLLPALPLDGGRMLRAVLARLMRPRTATLLGAWLGVCLGAAMAGLGIVLLLHQMLQPTFLTMGAFLVFAAIREMRMLPQVQMAAMLNRRDALRRGDGIRLKHIAIDARTSAGEALSMLNANRYNILLVIGRDMRVCGQLDEGALLDGIARYNVDICVGELLQRD
jgi:stage IV sporulation protein FB